MAGRTGCHGHITRWMVVAIALASLTFAIPAAAADEDEALRASLSQYPLDEDVGAFRVSVRAANVRERPETNSARTQLLKRGALVKSLGRVKATRWYAVELDHAFIGFMYDKTLEPVPDSELSEAQRQDLGLEPPENPLEGVSIEEMAGAFVAQGRDLAIRAKPAGDSRTVGRLHRGERIDAIGRVADAPDWVAVGNDGEAVGFMPEKGLMRVVDAGLSQPMNGKLQIDGGITCVYELAFKGRSAVTGEVFGSADYTANLACTRNGILEMFSAMMFIIEGSRQTDKGDVHQVNLDILPLGDAERPFSVIMGYNSTAGTIAYETSSSANLVRRRFTSERPATSITETLSAAIEIGLNALNETAWSEIAGL
ncbi:MAG: SH3 domain-containing protein [Rhodospirillales bacterium]